MLVRVLKGSKPEPKNTDQTSKHGAAWLVWFPSAIIIFSAYFPNNIIKLISHWKHWACEIYAGFCEAEEELIQAALSYSTISNYLGTVRHPPSPTCSWEHLLDQLLDLGLHPLV